MDLSWMNELCGDREGIARPFRLDVLLGDRRAKRAGRIVAASSGFSVVAVAAELADLEDLGVPSALPAVPASLVDLLQGMVRLEDGGEETSLARLRTFLAYQVTTDDLLPCGLCRGSGHFRCDCGAGKNDCSRCHGTGKAGAAKWLGVRAARIAGHRVDQNRCLAALRHLPGERVQLRTVGTRLLGITGPGWWFAIVPLGPLGNKDPAHDEMDPLYIADDRFAARQDPDAIVALGSPA